MLALIPAAFVQSIVRHVLTVAGGWLMAKGIGDAAYVELAVGFGTTTAALVWSYLTHSAAPK